MEKRTSISHWKAWCAFVYTVINHIILYTAASIKYFCRGLENTWNCTLAGKNILGFFPLKAERKLIIFSCFIPGTSICFALKQWFVGWALPASPDLGGGKWWDGCCKHIHVQIVLLQGCLQRLSSGSHLNCLQISLFLDTRHYPTFPTHLVCFLRACKDILCEISFFWESGQFL